MGYPLTWKRFINRNHLAVGGYGERMTGFNIDGPRTMADLTPEDFNPGVDFVDVLRGHIRDCYGEIGRMNGRWGALLGDLRRLENDTIDEGTICQHISVRTGIGVDAVAAVLKEWMEY